jgi:large subunit ribosomal protein L25
MSEITLKTVSRQIAKRSAKKLRSQGMIPGVYYSKAKEPIHLSAELLALKPIIYTAHKKIFDLYIDDSDKPIECIVKDTAFDPVTDKLIHFDLYGITKGKMMSVEVPIILKGQAVGVREGGVIQHSLHRVKIHCLPSDMPDSFEIDISDLSIGKSVHLKDIEKEGIHFDLSPDSVIVSVLHPRLIKEDEVKPEAEVKEGEVAAPAEEKDKDKKEE